MRTLLPELLRAVAMAGTPGAVNPGAPGELKLPLTSVGRLARVKPPPSRPELRGLTAASIVSRSLTQLVDFVTPDG